MSKRRKKFKLMGYHFRAVELRYEGNTYAQIAKFLTEMYKRDFKDSKVRGWFSAGGTLEQEYLDYAAKENDRRRRLVLHELKKITPMIPAKIKQLLDRLDSKNQPKLDMVTVQTVFKLCKLLGFQVDEGNVDDPLADYFRRQDNELETINKKTE